MEVFGLIIVQYFITQALTGTAWYITLLVWAVPAAIGFGILYDVLTSAFKGR